MKKLTARSRLDSSIDINQQDLESFVEPDNASEAQGIKPYDILSLASIPRAGDAAALSLIPANRNVDVSKCALVQLCRG